MTKKALIEALADIEDSAHIEFEGMLSSYVPRIKVICGKGQYAMVYYCCLPPNHEGRCFCGHKRIYFEPTEFDG